MEKVIQPIDPIAIKLGPFQVHWYGVIIGLAIILALYIAVKETEKRGFDKDLFIDLMFWAIPIAIFSQGFIMSYFNGTIMDKIPANIDIWNGGIAIHGALIGGVITTIGLRKKQVSFWQVVDIAALSIILGQAIGRWGNFINQEAHGGDVTRTFLENLQLPEFIINQIYIDGTYYHPTFLYESIWNLLALFS